MVGETDSRQISRRLLLEVGGAGIAATVLGTNLAMADEQNPPQIQYCLGTTDFSVTLPLNKDNLGHFLGRLDVLNISESKDGKGRRTIEILLAHNPDAGVDLDKPDSALYRWGETLKKRLNDNGYQPDVILGFHPPGSPDMISEDEKEVNQAVNRVYNMLEFAKVAGASVLAGPFHREHKKFANRSERELILPLRKIAARGAKLGVKPAVEMIRGLETDSLNSYHNTLPVIKEAHDKMYLHWDTAHAFLEEPGTLEHSVKEVYDSGRLGHVHISAAGRGPLIQGDYVTVALPRVLKVLRDVGYKGSVDFEGFHYAFWPAVGRVDNVGARGMNDTDRNALNLGETKKSISILSGVYNNLDKI